MNFLTGQGTLSTSGPNGAVYEDALVGIDLGSLVLFFLSSSSCPSLRSIHAAASGWKLQILDDRQHPDRCQNRAGLDASLWSHDLEIQRKKQVQVRTSW